MSLMGIADIMEMGGSASTKKVDPYVLAISIFAFSCLAVAGTAVCPVRRGEVACCPMLLRAL